MEKRQRRRFSVPGTTLLFKKKAILWKKLEYSNDDYPVLGMSRGGLRFLSGDRIKVGLPIRVKLSIPGTGIQPEIDAVVCWSSRKGKEGDRYQTGVSFKSFGPGKKENPVEILSYIKTLESSHMMPECSSIFA
jgi:hypothetical protein